MLIHANRDELLRLSKQAALAVPKTTEIIDLRGIHMEADARRSMLTLTSTNQEIAIQTSMSAVVEQAGSIVIDVKLLPSLLSRLPEKTLDIELGDNGQLTVCSGTARYRLGVSSGEKYPMPELPFPDDTVPVTGLRSLVRRPRLPRWRAPARR
jgi:DNA polymerase-3 subunit beta